jgi:Glyoxalase-like domain
MTTSDAPPLPRVRQAVIAARDLDAVVDLLRSALGLGEPFADPAVEYFGLRNAVFALEDTFLEVVSPVRDGTPAGRRIERARGDCGYMVMAQVGALAPARERASALGIREVFEIEVDDIAEVHLHPADMHGAIVSLSEPRPSSGWRWGGPDWPARSAPLRVHGVTLAVADPEAVADRWREVIGSLPGIRFTRDAAEPGLVEIAVGGVAAPREPLQVGGVRITPSGSPPSPRTGGP